MCKKTTEIVLTATFVGGVLFAIYLAMYWAIPAVAVASQHSAKKAIKDACAKTPGCLRAYVDVGFSTESGCPAYIAHLTMKSGADSTALAKKAKTAMEVTIKNLPIPFAWIANGSNIAVKVNHRD